MPQWRDTFDRAQTPQGASSAIGLLPVYNANQPTYSIGSIVYADTATTLARLAPNTTTTQKFLSMTGTGSAGAAPVWDTLTSADITDFNEAVDDRAAALIQNGTGISWSYNDGAGTLTPTVTLAPFTTTDLAEGTNLYFTNERVDDRVDALIQDGTGITWTYDDTLNTLTPTVTITQYTDEMAQDATASLIQNGTGITWSYNDGLNTLTPTVTITQYTDEMAQDAVATLIQNGTGITWSYNDALNTLTPTVTITQYTDELAQDAVGGILTDSSSIDFTYNDATPSITAAVIWTSPGTIGSVAPNSGVFTTLQANGNVTLGDAAGDTVTITGTVQGTTLFASGAALSFNSADVTVTHSSNTLTFAGATTGYVFNDGQINAVQGQIKFPATDNPSADANTLDDYQESDFTPALTVGGSATGVTFSAQTGKATKIGRLVHIQLHITLTNNGTGSGAVVVTNLPYAAAVTSNLSMWIGATDASRFWQPVILSGATSINLQYLNGTATANATETQIPNNADFYINGCYIV